MLYKLVGDIPGVSKKKALKLTKKGFDKASLLLGQYCRLHKDKDLFKDWIIELVCMTNDTAEKIYKALSGWDICHL